MMVIFEIVRLYLGYVGNLCERVPELTGFWLLTLMVEVPLSTFLLFIVWFPIDLDKTLDKRIGFFVPMQFALELIHTIFVYLELILGFFALRVLARYQISRFHYKQFEKYQYDQNIDLTKNGDFDSNDWLKSLGHESGNTFAMKELRVTVFVV
jgi:transmembrane protein 17